MAQDRAMILTGTRMHLSNGATSNDLEWHSDFKAMPLFDTE